jgi:hypothetical protein
VEVVASGNPLCVSHTRISAQTCYTKCRIALNNDIIEAPWLVNGGHGASLRHHNQPHKSQRASTHHPHAPPYSVGGSGSGLLSSRQPIHTYFTTAVCVCTSKAHFRTRVHGQYSRFTRHLSTSRGLVVVARALFVAYSDWLL